MAIDYKKELENAARTMIMIHRPETLIKLIIRTIVRKVDVKHAGILLYEKDKDTYILTFSGGERGLKIPAGYAQVKRESSLIKFFNSKKNFLFSSHGVLVYSRINSFLKKPFLKKKPSLKELLNSVKRQMANLQTVACIPSYFPVGSAQDKRDKLLGLLLLGEKESGKRFNQEEFDFLVALSSDVSMAIRNAQLFADLQAELERKNRLFIETTVALAKAIETKDKYTRGHTERVTQYSINIAKKIISNGLATVEPKFLENLQLAGLLHDIGKIGVDEAILNKNGYLNYSERKAIEGHPLKGVAILEPIRELKDAILGVKYHHERYDGKGYPDGLKGEEIPLIASIIAVSDAFDAMSTDRPYRKALAKKDAVEEIRKLSGKQFDPLVVKAMLEVYKEGGI